MGDCASNMDDEKQFEIVATEPSELEKALIMESELLELLMIAPIKCTIKAYALESVHALKGKAAQMLGLRKPLGEFLELEFEGHTVTQNDDTLAALGMRQLAKFSILGDIEDVKAHTADLHDAVREHRTDEIKLVCSRAPARVHELDSHGDTPIQYTGDYLDALEMLLEAEADPNAQNHLGWTALHRAATADYAQTTIRLIQAQADLELTDHYGGTPLRWAKEGGCRRTIKILDQAASKSPQRGLSKSPQAGLSQSPMKCG